MGKSKTRIFRKGINDRFLNMTRENAIEEAVKYLCSGSVSSAKELITMFGLSPEELLEAGADYEAIVALKNIFGT